MLFMFEVTRSDIVAGRSNPGSSMVSVSTRAGVQGQPKSDDTFLNTADILINPDDCPIQCNADLIRKLVDLFVKHKNLEILNVKDCRARLNSSLFFLVLLFFCQGSFPYSNTVDSTSHDVPLLWPCTDRSFFFWEGLFSSSLFDVSHLDQGRDLFGQIVN